MHLYTSILYTDFQLLPGIFSLTPALTPPFPRALCCLPAALSVNQVARALCSGGDGVQWGKIPKEGKHLCWVWDGHLDHLQFRGGSNASSGFPFLEWFQSRCMLGNMASKVPLAIVRLLPQLCELAWTTLGARLGTVPKWWRGGQAEGRGAGHPHFYGLGQGEQDLSLHPLSVGFSHAVL